MIPRHGDGSAPPLFVFSVYTDQKYRIWVKYGSLIAVSTSHEGELTSMPLVKDLAGVLSIKDIGWILYGALHSSGIRPQPRIASMTVAEVLQVMWKQTHAHIFFCPLEYGPKMEVPCI